MPWSFLYSSAIQATMRWSQSSPPRYVSPEVERTSTTPSPTSRMETSNVPSSTSRSSCHVINEMMEI